MVFNYNLISFNYYHKKYFYKMIKNKYFILSFSQILLYILKLSYIKYYDILFVIINIFSIYFI